MYGYVLSVIFIAFFAYGLMTLLKRTGFLMSRKKWIKLISNLLIPFICMLISPFVPFYEKDVNLSTKMIIGAAVGLNVGFVLAVLKGYIRLYSSEGKKGIPAVMQATAEVLDKNIDQFGNTLPPK